MIAITPRKYPRTASRHVRSRVSTSLRTWAADVLGHFVPDCSTAVRRRGGNKNSTRGGVVVAAVLKNTFSTADHPGGQSLTALEMAPPGPFTSTAHQKRQSIDVVYAALPFDAVAPSSLKLEGICAGCIADRCAVADDSFDSQLCPMEVADFDGFHKAAVLVSRHDAVEFFGHETDVGNERFTQSVAGSHNSSFRYGVFQGVNIFSLYNKNYKYATYYG